MPSSPLLPPGVSLAQGHAAPVSNGSVDMKARAGAPPLHTHTPEENESRQRKRLRATVPPAEPAPCPKAFVGVAWLPCWAHQLGSWLGILLNLHTKCALIPGEAVVRLALALLQNQIQSMISAGATSFFPHTFDTVAAAALWVAIKFATPRGAVPGASFMCTALGVTMDGLRDAELLLLESVDWDVYKIAKKVGIVITEPYNP